MLQSRYGGPQCLNVFFLHVSVIFSEGSGSSLVKGGLSMGDCGVGQRCGRACYAGCGDCELSRSAVHAEEWDTGDQAASENLARLLSLKSPGLIPQAGAFPLPIVDSTSSWVLISPISL
jgi:hypothetical protein